MSRKESFKKISAPRDITSVRQQSLNREQRELDPLDEEQRAFEDAGFPMSLHNASERERRFRASVAFILGSEGLTKPSTESSTTLPSSTEIDDGELQPPRSDEGPPEQEQA